MAQNAIDRPERRQDDDCLKAGDHLAGQDHRWQECRVYHDEDEG